MVLRSGQILNNRYRIVKLLGQGGFGAVYRAWDMNMECPRAVKENLDTSPEAQKQFKLEAQLLGQLTHLNLPKVIDHFIISGQGQYLVMEYVEGEDLQEMLDKRGGPLPESLVLPWIEQVCDALGYLHSQNPPIIHRDVKPANIKITPDGRAMLVDFGIAKVFDPLLSTTVGARAVTPGYSPHEQYGQGKTDPRTDIYALGATLYTLLTGQVPVESIQRMITDPLLPPEQINPAIAPNVAGAIRRAMENDPNQRPASTKAFKDTLKAPVPIVSTLPLSQPVSTQTFPYQSGQTRSAAVQTKPFQSATMKKWLPWAAGLFLIIILVVVFWPRGNGPSEEDSLEPEALVVDTQTPIVTVRPNSTETLTPSPSPAASATPPPSLTPVPTLGIGSNQISLIDGMVMVYIPEGEFEMGSEDGENDERPVHTVYLDPYWMDQTKVTNAMYATFLNDQGNQEEGDYTWLDAGDEDVLIRQNSGTWQPEDGYADHPVIEVTWYGARAYCQWASRRLPTEAEWEKAARGNLVGMKYPWGNEAPVCTPGALNGAQYDPCDGRTVPVKTFAPNGYGLFDMAGNVWEWVVDWYLSDYYNTYSSESWPQNPTGPENGTVRGLRGGSWYGDGGNLRVADRSYGYAPVSSYDVVGFRCAASPGP